MPTPPTTCSDHSKFGFANAVGRRRRKGPVFNIIRAQITLYLFLLFFAFGHAGITMVETAVGVTFTASIIAYYLGNRGMRLIVPLPFALAFILIVYALANLLFNQTGSDGFHGDSNQFLRLTTLVISIGVSFGFYLYIVTFRDLNYVLGVIYLCLLGSAALMIVGQTDMSSAGNDDRISGGLGSPNQTASSITVMTSLLLFPFAQLIASKKGGKRILLAVFFMLVLTFYINLFYTGSRQGMVLSAVTIMFAGSITLSGVRRRPLLSSLIIGSLFAGFAAIATGIIDLSNNYFVMRLLNLVSLWNDSVLIVKESSVYERNAMVDRGLEIWQERPLFGFGIDSFRYISGFETYSHNNFIDLMVGTGIIGLFIYLAIHLAAIKKIISDKRVQTPVRHAGAFCIMILIISGFAIVIYYSRLHWVAFGIIVSAHHYYRRSHLNRDGFAYSPSATVRQIGQIA